MTTKRAKTDRPKTLTEAREHFGAVFVSDLPDDAPERAAAWRELDTAAHAAGVYREATRPLKDLEADLANATGERKTVLDHARRFILTRTHATATLKALHAGRTFEKREAIRTAEAEAAAQREAAREAQRRKETQDRNAARIAEGERREAEAREREAFDRSFKEATITLAKKAPPVAISKYSMKKKTATARRNGRLGGRLPADDEEDRQKALVDLGRRLHNGGTMSAACKAVIKQYGLSIQPRALEKAYKAKRARRRGGVVTN